MPKDKIKIRPFNSMTDLDACRDLQALVWGFSSSGEGVSKEILVVASKTGGQVAGAFVGAVLVGFVLAFPAYDQRERYLYSHMAAVRPAYQGQGVGRRLKLWQRDEALQQGIRRIEWAFDPMQGRNANFNINRLGAIVRRYHRDYYYGDTGSFLHAGLPSDRLIAEWWLTTPRVEAALAGRPHKPAMTARRVAVPRKVEQWRHQNQEEAEKILLATREEFERLLGAGFAVTAVEKSEADSTYVFEPYESVAKSVSGGA